MRHAIALAAICLTVAAFVAGGIGSMAVNGMGWLLPPLAALDRC